MSGFPTPTMQDAFRHYPADALFIEKIVSRVPLSLRASVKNTYSYQYSNAGRQAANLYLLSVSDYLQGKTLLMLSDENIRAKAERLAKHCKTKDMEQAAAYMSSMGLPFPAGKTDDSKLARIQCPIWWERGLRRKQDREQEHLFIQLGLLRKGLQPYCSTDLMKRIQQRHQRSLEVLEGFEAVSDEGETVDLLEVLKGSVANPAIRRAEMMMRMRGFEDHATEQGHVNVFYTLTCPSKYHRHSGPALNDKYQHSTPREAQAYLVGIWKKIRAKLKRDGLNVYGFRIAEPHHDGTPHWHLSLFMRTNHRKAVTAIMKTYAMQEDGDEPGAAKHRFEAVTVDPAKGSATGYIAKYISKNIDGFGMDTDDETGDPASESATRVCAWARNWGIRQFQQIGGAPVGVWRELRRVDDAPEGLLEDAREAADSGNWALYLTLQGGADADRKTQPLRVFTVEHIDTETGELHQNRYGEFVDKIKGIALAGSATLETRLKTWTIQEKTGATAVTPLDSTKPHASHDVLASALATFTPCPTPDSDRNFLQFSGFSASPWSPVNNCTEYPLTPAEIETAAAWEAKEKAKPPLEVRQERAAIQLESLEVAYD